MARPGRRAKAPTAFTLIELLIVVLIIAILAAIAIPNFLEFQVRAKIAKAHNDMRTIVTALEAYCVDEGEYPAYLNGADGPPGLYRARHYVPVRLTTPIAYLTSIPNDAFTIKEAGVLPFTYFHNYDASEVNRMRLKEYIYFSAPPPQDAYVAKYIYVVSSVGPDLDWDMEPTWGDAGGHLKYDPTNGSVSLGVISRFGPGS